MIHCFVFVLTKCGMTIYTTQKVMNLKKFHTYDVIIKEDWYIIEHFLKLVLFVINCIKINNDYYIRLPVIYVKNNSSWKRCLWNIYIYIYIWYYIEWSTWEISSCHIWTSQIKNNLSSIFLNIWWSCSGIVMMAKIITNFVNIHI